MPTFHMLDKSQAPGHEYNWFVIDPQPEPQDTDPRTWLSVDLIAITDDPHNPALVLYRRDHAPHAGELSLPGAVMNPAKGQTVAQTATWIADERAHTRTVPGTEPHPVTVVSDPTRDERGHTVSLVTLIRVTPPSPDSDTVLIHTGDPIPTDMPFQHSAMLTNAAHRASIGILTDPDITRALVSADPAHAITGTGLYQTCRLLHHLAGGTPDHAPTAEAVRRRRSRSTTLTPAGTTPAKTRPETTFAAAPPT